MTMTFNTDLYEVRVQIDRLQDGAAEHRRISARRRSVRHHGIYVAHPITGIRVERIHRMQAEVSEALDRVGECIGRRLVPFFPMRTTHLEPHETGANEYPDSDALFALPRHYTLQNRMDALVHCDAVLIILDVPDDAGRLRASKGIPFDYGWARAAGRPCVTASADGNPNLVEALRQSSTVYATIKEATAALSRVIEDGSVIERPVCDMFHFPREDLCHDTLSRLAQADGARYRNGPRAIIGICEGGKRNPNWHGQVGEVCDWVVSDQVEADLILGQLLSRSVLAEYHRGLPHELLSSSSKGDRHVALEGH